MKNSSPLPLKIEPITEKDKLEAVSFFAKNKGGSSNDYYNTINVLSQSDAYSFINKYKTAKNLELKIQECRDKLDDLEKEKGSLYSPKLVNDVKNDIESMSTSFRNILTDMELTLVKNKKGLNSGYINDINRVTIIIAEIFSYNGGNKLTLNSKIRSKLNLHNKIESEQKLIRLFNDFREAHIAYFEDATAANQEREMESKKKLFDFLIAIDVFTETEVDKWLVSTVNKNFKHELVK